MFEKMRAKLFLRPKYFLLEVDPFQKGFPVRESKQVRYPGNDTIMKHGLHEAPKEGEMRNK